MDNKERLFLQRAVDLAMEGIGNGGGPFGAVIVKGDEIISEAFNEVVSSGDPTAHAEVLAIRRACRITGSHSLEGCTIYASCEPCPMCLGAICWAGIDEVVFAAGRRDAAAAGFSDEKFYDELLKDPSDRRIRFRRLKGIDGKDVFRAWNEYEERIPY